MIKNKIADIMLGMVGKRFDGYKTIVGGIGLILYAVLCVASKLFPDMNLPGGNESWEAISGSFSAGLILLGVIHKAYKTGLETPVSTTTLQDDPMKDGGT